MDGVERAAAAAREVDALAERCSAAAGGALPDELRVALDEARGRARELAAQAAALAPFGGGGAGLHGGDVNDVRLARLAQLVRTLRGVETDLERDDATTAAERLAAPPPWPARLGPDERALLQALEPATQVP